MMIVHDQQMTPFDFWVKGQGHIDLKGKNGLRSITEMLRPRNFKCGMMIVDDQ
jgi:peptidyl-tRNA hydrolase